MKVEVRLYATLRKYLPPGTEGGSALVDIPVGSAVRDVIAYLKIPKDITHLAMVNGKHSPRDKTLREGDVVIMFLPVGGG